MKKKIVSLFAVLALCLAFAVPAFAANYSKWTATEFSGQTDFGYFFTYEGEDRSSYPYQAVNYNFSVKISIPLENTGVSSVFATSVWPFSLIFSLARRNEGNFFQAVPTTLSSSLAEVRLASLVAWA